MQIPRMLVGFLAEGLEAVASYMRFLRLLFTHREPWRVYLRNTIEECVQIGLGSLFIVFMVSVFIGAVTSLQISYNTEGLGQALPRDFLVGLGVRNMIILEFSPTVLAIVFAGKVGSSISSQLGSMRISEQIDALEVMGINAASYLVLPKVLASLLMYPTLVIISGFLAIYGGFIASVNVIPIAAEDYIDGIRMNFEGFTVLLAMYKALIFAFIVSTVAAYRGFHTSGGAVEVGQASTGAVTTNCIAILLADYIITKLLLT